MTTSDPVGNFVSSLTNAARDLSLLYVGTPDDRAREHLQGFLDRIEPRMAEEVGADLAKRIVEALRTAVLSRKSEIEKSGSSRA